MASDYPGGLDSFDTIASDKKTSDAVGGRTHRDMHNDLGDAIEAVQTELGANPSGSDATVAARLTAIEAGTNLGTNSVGATQLADNAVDTNAIQSKAVTAAKIADDTITATQIAANAVGASELADNAVDTAAIADGAVTPAKLATTGRFVFPTGAANGYGFTSGASHLSGTGTPEGVVTAAPGSTWLQTDSTTDVKGWLKWVKASGTGNTGWVAGPEADTGWRDVPTTNTASGTLGIRRVGNTVILDFSVLELTTGSGSVGLYAPPGGFRIARGTMGYLRRNHDQTKLQLIWWDPALVSWQSESGSVAWTTTHPTGTPANGMTGQLAAVTTEAWPTSLPGTAA